MPNPVKRVRDILKLQAEPSLSKAWETNEVITNAMINACINVIYFIFYKRLVIPWYKIIRFIHPLSFPLEFIPLSSSGPFSYKYIQTLLSISNVSKQTPKKVLRNTTFWNGFWRGCFPEHLNLNHFKSRIFPSYPVLHFLLPPLVNISHT